MRKSATSACQALSWALNVEAERYERKSILITANQPFSGWNNVFPDP